MKWFAMLLFLVLQTNATIGQIRPQPIVTSDTISHDSIRIENNVEGKKEKKNSFFTVFSGQPGRAALYSLLVPGLGQVYNKRYWKVPIVLGIEGAALYHLVNSLSNFSDLDQAYLALIANGGSSSDITTAFNSRQGARKTKEYAWVFMSLAHLLNVVDAFVNRHLINFDVSEDLSIQQISDDNHNSSFELNVPQITFLTIRIPLSR